MSKNNKPEVNENINKNNVNAEVKDTVETTVDKAETNSNEVIEEVKKEEPVKSEPKKVNEVKVETPTKKEPVVKAEPVKETYISNSTVDTPISVGTYVNINNGAKSATGTNLPVYVYGKRFKVKKILGDRLVLTSGIAISHEVAVNIKDVTVIY